MRLPTSFLAALCAGGARGIRILQSNDDGWAELNVRAFHDALSAAGHDVLLSAPAENQSGTGSSDVEPRARDQACQYDSCPAGSGPVGSNATDARLNWVNSYPVTATKYGLEQLGPVVWNKQPAELVVTGPNVGSNVWVQLPFSGTVGSAAYAAHVAKLPSIAFSGLSGDPLAWTTNPVPQRSLVYARLAARLVDAVVAAGTPYLPEDVFLNVNFPEVEGDCTDPASFKWVMSRINVGLLSARDVDTCGRTRLPREAVVVTKGGCHIAVSVGDAADKTTASAEKQAAVLAKLSGLFTCLP